MSEIDPFEMLDAIDTPVAPEPRKALPDGEKPERKHERYHLGIMQGDRLAGDFDAEVSAARYGLSRFHASVIAGKSKDDIINDIELALAQLFPMEPKSKSKMATHRYIRVGALILAAVHGGKSEEEAIRALLG